MQEVDLWLPAQLQLFLFTPRLRFINQKSNKFSTNENANPALGLPSQRNRGLSKDTSNNITDSINKSKADGFKRPGLRLDILNHWSY